MKCENCKWHKVITDRGDRVTIEYLECHRHAPRKLHGTGTGYDSEVWPQVERDDFCGEFEAKELNPGPGSHA